MTWTYGGDPGTGTAAQRRDAVRLRIGDTTSTDPQLTDEEIAYALSDASNSVLAAALTSCKWLVSRYARQADIKMGETSVSASQRAKAYTALVGQLESELLTGTSAAPYVGGTSIADKQIDRDDTDVVQPSFTRDDDRYAGTSEVPSVPYDWRS